MHAAVFEERKKLKYIWKLFFRLTFHSIYNGSRKYWSFRWWSDQSGNWKAVDILRDDRGIRCRTLCTSCWYDHKHQLQSFTTNTRYNHSLQTLATIIHYKHPLQLFTTNTRYNHSSQTPATIIHYKHPLQSFTTNTGYNHSSQTPTTIIHYKHSLQSLIKHPRYNHSLNTPATITSFITNTRYNHSLQTLATIIH